VGLVSDGLHLNPGDSLYVRAHRGGVRGAFTLDDAMGHSNRMVESLR
jgi:hypothetical protein